MSNLPELTVSEMWPQILSLVKWKQVEYFNCCHVH